MKSIMHDLYFGNIDPSERPPSQDREYNELRDKIVSEEEYFTNKMSRDDYRRFEDYKELLWRFNTIEDIENFSYGFRLGTLLMMDVFSNENRTLQNGN